MYGVLANCLSNSFKCLCSA